MSEFSEEISQSFINWFNNYTDGYIEPRSTSNEEAGIINNYIRSHSKVINRKKINKIKIEMPDELFEL